MVNQMRTSTWKKNYSYHICEIDSDDLVVCLYMKFSFCLYSMKMYQTQYNAIISNIVFIQMLLRYFQTEWSVFFTLQCEFVTSCNFSNDASLVSARTGGWGGGGVREDGQPNVDRPGQGEGGPKNSQISADILYERPLMMTLTRKKVWGKRKEQVRGGSWLIHHLQNMSYQKIYRFWYYVVNDEVSSTSS